MTVTAKHILDSTVFLAETSERVALLSELGILDTPTESDFNAVVVLLSEALGTPVAAISLLDDTRQWFKAHVGLTATETPFDLSLCLDTCSHRQMLVIEDTALDPGLSQHPAVLAEQPVRFYAGMPLEVEGIVIGALCAADSRPRSLTASGRDVLRSAATVIRELLVRRLQHQRDQAAERAATELALNNCDWTWVVDAYGRLSSIDGPFESRTGLASDAVIGLRLRDAAGDVGGTHESSWRTIHEALALGAPFRDQPVRWHIARGGVRINLTGVPILTASGKLAGFRGAASMTSSCAGEVSGPTLEASASMDTSSRPDSFEPIHGEQFSIQTLINALPAHIAVIDGNETILHVNQSSIHFLSSPGLRCEAAWIGRPFAAFCDATVGVSADDVSGARQCIDAVLGGDAIKQSFEYACTSPGPSHWLRLTVTPISDYGVLGAVLTQIDISEGRRAEMALRQSEAMLDMAGRAASVGAWSFDLQSGALRWSGQTSALHDEPTGYSPSLQRALEYYGQPDRSIMTEAFSRCCRDAVPFDIEVHITTRRGIKRWLRTIGTAVCDPAGRVTCVQGSVQDVTSRREVEHERHQVTLRLQSTLDSITDGFVTLDHTWRITYVNAWAEELFGLPESRSLGRDLRELFPGFAQSHVGLQFSEATAQGRPMRFEAELEASGRWLLINAYPADEGLTVYFRDISAERAARQRLEIFEACIAHLNDGVIITEVNPTTSTQPIVRFANAAHERASGWTASELIGKPWVCPQAPAIEMPTLAGADDGVQKPGASHAEVLRQRRQGAPYWVEVDVIPVAIEGERQSHFVSIERDITQRKAAEDALRMVNLQLEDRVRDRTAELVHARQEAERANSAKTAFLAGMSHELRTPLAGIIGMLDVLEESLQEVAQLNVADLIREAADSLLRIIGDILDTAKIEAGKLDLEFNSIDLENLVERVCSMLRPTASSQGVSLDLFVDPCIDSLVLADEIRLRQVLFNLVGNAIKFSTGVNRAGQVTVRMRLVERLAEQFKVEISVEDNGIGIDEAAIPNLFTPFMQADSSTTRRFGGTGLGLSICKRLLDLMGGNIKVSSNLREGSLFTVSLTLALDTSASVPRNAVGLAGVSCLLIGQESELADRLAAYLLPVGVQLLRCDDIATAAATTACQAKTVWLLLSNQHDADLQQLLLAHPELEIYILRFGSAHTKTTHFCNRPCVEADLTQLGRRSLLNAMQTMLSEACIRDGKGRPTSTATPDFTASPAQSGGATQTILIAEDNPLSRMVMQRQIHALGIQAEVVEDGEQALEKWRSGNHALILTDIHMPIMDGHALASAIRSEEPIGQRIPIVALSANTALDEEARCLAAGMDAFMTKPVRLLQLRAILERHLGDTLFGSDDKRKVRQENLPDRVVDLRVLQDLVGDDPYVIDALLRQFQISGKGWLKTIRQGLVDGDVETILAEVHKLKSAARSLGAHQLSNSCEQLEYIAKNVSGMRVLRDCVEELCTQLINVLTHLFTLLPGSAISEASKAPSFTG